eukprot:m.139975 g.139975  ORF g.139975 m.139975 type:complete len:380 (+) comp11516_c0_seq1:101-1240(+)
MGPPAMQMTFVLLLLSAGTAYANYQFTRNDWTRLGYCNTRLNTSWDYARSDLAVMAQRATSVKICQMGSTTDCVTSAPNSFPIVNLRNGYILVSADQPNRCVRSQQCIRSVWSGPSNRVNDLMWTASGSCLGQPPTQPTDVYHACGNGQGMHFAISSRYPGGGAVNVCSWGSGNGGWGTGRGQLELFINYQSTAQPTPAPTVSPTSPTAAPTAAPTGWYEHPAVPNVTSLALLVDQMQADMSSMAIQMSQQFSITHQAISVAVSQSQANLSTQIASTNTAVLNNEISLADTMATQRGIAANYTALLDALQTAVSASSGPGTTLTPGVTGLPRIEATSDNGLAISASSSVQVSSGSCVTNDLCDATRFAQALKEALAQVV